MNEAIAPIDDLASPADLAPAAAAGAQPAAPGFGDWFAREVREVDAKLNSADAQMRSVATGTAANLHEVMIRLEEARLSFQLLAQVRNRVLDAYQEMMRMQL